MLSPYDIRTEETRKRLGAPNPYYPNKVYKSPDNLYFFINHRGYYHVLKPCKISYDSIFSHYEIRDLLLRADDTVKEVKSTGYYKTREDCVARIEERLAPNP